MTNNEHFNQLIERIFQLNMELVRQDVRIWGLEFELQLAKELNRATSDLIKEVVLVGQDEPIQQ